MNLANSRPPLVTASPIPPSPLIQRLHDVDYCARMNAKYLSGGRDSEVGIYFTDKADEVRSVLDRLNAGKNVSADEINRALDTSYARRIGGYSC